jgi:hypothetical protein
MKNAYGGVVINFSGQVLLRQPAGHYKGDRWAKGNEVAQLIQLNQRPKRRRRDLRVPKLALALFWSLDPALHPSAPAQAQLEVVGTSR